MAAPDAVPAMNVQVTDRQGALHTVGFIDGLSLMETIRDGGIDEVLALCGGCCSCATCHVFVDEAWMTEVGPPNPDELDLLDTSSYKSDQSRLSCQIELTERLSGLSVRIAPED